MYAIHRNRSAEGVSLITQILYAVVFCTRYLDIFQEVFPWNLFFKIFYISTSFYIVGLMQWVYPRTREREVSWKLGAAAAGGSLAISPFAMLIFEKHWSFSTVRAAPEKARILPVDEWFLARSRLTKLSLRG